MTEEEKPLPEDELKRRILLLPSERHCWCVRFSHYYPFELSSVWKQPSTLRPAHLMLRVNHNLLTTHFSLSEQYASLGFLLK